MFVPGSFSLDFLGPGLSGASQVVRWRGGDCISVESSCCSCMMITSLCYCVGITLRGCDDMLMIVLFSRLTSKYSHVVLLGLLLSHLPELVSLTWL